MATETTTTERGIKNLPCPCCSTDSALTVRIEDGVLVCGDCEMEMTAEELEVRLKAWGKLCEWMKALPTMAFGEE